MFPKVMGAFGELDSEGSFLKLGAYYVLKVETMRTLIIWEMSVTVYMCMNLGEVTFFWASTHQLFKPGSSLANKEWAISPACSSLWGSCVHMWLEMMLLSIWEGRCPFTWLCPEGPCAESEFKQSAWPWGHLFHRWSGCSASLKPFTVINDLWWEICLSLSFSVASPWHTLVCNLLVQIDR